MNTALLRTEWIWPLPEILELLKEEVRIAAIQKAKGNIAVQELAAKFKVNYKWLERNFIRHIGITPKEFARLQRFIHTYFDCISTDKPALLDIALDNGYFDSSHFTKEFRRFTGKAPQAYLNKRSRCI